MGNSSLRHNSTPFYIIHSIPYSQRSGGIKYLQFNGTSHTSPCPNIGPLFSQFWTSIFEFPNTISPLILIELGQFFKYELIMLAKSRCEHMSIERKHKSSFLRSRNQSLLCYEQLSHIHTELLNNLKYPCMAISSKVMI